MQSSDKQPYVVQIRVAYSDHALSLLLWTGGCDPLDVLGWSSNVGGKSPSSPERGGEGEKQGAHFEWVK
ncbi:hypothetical protein GDO78_003601 [Eleutherodactylus coqui]|uniref:Uncharacterized protein n=1 Tax=Eleutherodactylus coqui TaxID=57060 RepID=A0A8J6K0V2_ELECQ|nr:hypothetical protein GDO78_003601 [Eleutherodactylus coqui]